MTYWLLLIGSALFGGLLGLGYFGGLWVTVRRVRRAQWSKGLLLGSFLVRTVFALAGFYLVLRFMGSRWEMVALCLIGFMGARLLLVQRWGSKHTTLSHDPKPNAS